MFLSSPVMLNLRASFRNMSKSRPISTCLLHINDNSKGRWPLHFCVQSELLHFSMLEPRNSSEWFEEERPSPGTDGQTFLYDHRVTFAVCTCLCQRRSFPRSSDISVSIPTFDFKLQGFTLGAQYELLAGDCIYGFRKRSHNSPFRKVHLQVTPRWEGNEDSISRQAMERDYEDHV